MIHNNTITIYGVLYYCIFSSSPPPRDGYLGDGSDITTIHTKVSVPILLPGLTFGQG